MSEVTEYQNECKNKFEEVFRNIPGLQVELEWRTMAGERKMYCPRVDIAVGPFTNETRLEINYRNLIDENQQFIHKLIDCHLNNLQNNASDIAENRHLSRDYIFESLKERNNNPRCFLIIEIENKVSRKHVIGGVINASAIGKIGIMVAWTPEMLRAFINATSYFRFLGNVGKNTFDVGNTLILSKEQLLRCLSKK